MKICDALCTFPSNIIHKEPGDNVAEPSARLTKKSKTPNAPPLIFQKKCPETELQVGMALLLLAKLFVKTFRNFFK